MVKTMTDSFNTSAQLDEFRKLLKDQKAFDRTIEELLWRLNQPPQDFPRPAGEDQELFEGAFAIGEKLGHGAFSRVYAATQNITDRLVERPPKGKVIPVAESKPVVNLAPRAIKIFKAVEGVEDDMKTDLALREAMATQQVNHPHVIGIHGFGVFSGLAYIIQDRAMGGSLQDILDREGAIEPATTLEIVNQIASALEQTHKKGILHRDIKPRNILLMRPLEDGVDARLTDFGIGKFFETLHRDKGIEAFFMEHVDALWGSETEREGNPILQMFLEHFGAADLDQVDQRSLYDVFGDESKFVTALKKEERVIGTLSYIPPEGFYTSRELVPTSDQYSLAVSAYEMLTGSFPFGGETKADLIRHILFDPPFPLPDTFPRGEEIYAVLDRAMSKEHEDRYPSFRAFTKALAVAMDLPLTPITPASQITSHTGVTQVETGQIER